MKHGSLYSGIGGWLLAARWAGIENIFTCEIDKFCNKILDKHFPDTDRHYDIKETDFKTYAGRIDILSTSDPCQPFSFAGKRGGKADDRYLWPQTIRVIREVKPTYVVFENVSGYVDLALDSIIMDLESLAYKTEQYIIPASSVGARHKRNRLWLIAYPDSLGFPKIEFQKRTNIEVDKQWIKFDNGLLGGLKQSPQHIRGYDGLSSELDKDRVRSLGNSIVPQIAYIIFEAIKQIENEKLY